MASVHITLKSNIQFLGIPVGIFRVDDTSLTWREVLRKIELHLFGNYCVSDASKKFVAILEDKVEDLINQFEHPMYPYIIRVDKGIAHTRARYAQLKKEANAKKRKVGPQDLGNSVRPSFPPIVRRHNADVGERSSGPKRPRLGTNHFSVDGPGFSSNAKSPEVTHELNGDIDDTTIQDRQINEEDVKASVIRKLMQNISNGDLVVIKEEFLKMKADGKKTMKVARHIPTVVSFLDVLYSNQPNAN